MPRIKLPTISFFSAGSNGSYGIRTISSAVCCSVIGLSGGGWLML